ncbi:hypothetical protein BJY18_003862 [Amycolatopsis jiangsuensis]|uniref:Uncharacterized protein n=1 Tax=Amycolatopsis jiangsuensis TaxID=1181879 RepID=A0A840IYL2_9PSEU|nr:hypothetical protein [Amycolatopsis jiangsuensis]
MASERSIEAGYRDFGPLARAAFAEITETAAVLDAG